MKKCYNWENCSIHPVAHEGPCVPHTAEPEISRNEIEASSPFDIINARDLETAIDGPGNVLVVNTYDLPYTPLDPGIPKVDGGTKFDNGKPDLSIVPLVALEEIAAALSYGAKKYGRGNYQKGFENTRLISATLRHIFAYLEGEDIDKESGNKHLAHALSTLTMILDCEKLGTLVDVRGKKR